MFLLMVRCCVWKQTGVIAHSTEKRKYCTVLGAEMVKGPFLTSIIVLVQNCPNGRASLMVPWTEAPSRVQAWVSRGNETGTLIRECSDQN